jgi:hypothetical protein
MITWGTVVAGLIDVASGRWVECDLCHAQRPAALVTWVDPIIHFGKRPKDGRLGLVALCKGGCPRPAKA